VKDNVVPVRLGRQLFEAVPCKAKRWIELPNLGHNDPWPNSYYDELAEFLSQIEGQTSGQFKTGETDFIEFAAVIRHGGLHKRSASG
jgi:hypothetical protein